MKRMMLKHLATATAAAVLLGGPAMGQGAWIDITSEVTRLLGEKGSSGPYYLRNGSAKTIKSVNFKNTIYKRGEFSYSSHGLTIKVDYLFDCNSASYKLNDGQPGYWYNLSWITPDFDKQRIEWIAYKYLCAQSKDPWLLLAKNTEDREYWMNKAAGYSDKLNRYGKVSVFVIANTKKIGRITLSPEMLRLIVSCSTKRAAFYELSSMLDNNSIELDEPNPGSIGEEVVDLFCYK